jgi:hypothetical protein
MADKNPKAKTKGRDFPLSPTPNYETENKKDSIALRGYVEKFKSTGEESARDSFMSVGKRMMDRDIKAGKYPKKK